jgi:hypothetical protein
MVSGIEGYPKDVEEATARLKNCAITIPILAYLNKLAIENGYNRQIREGFLDETIDDSDKYDDHDDRADDRFPAIVMLAMPHYHKQGVPTELHYRLMLEVIVKSKSGKDIGEKYATVFVDIPAEAFNILPNIPNITWLNTSASTEDMNQFLTEWNEVDEDTLNENFIKDIENMLGKSSTEEE